ncbi:hypothetical protein BGZ80_000821 [Entomortierella chlamydospora]|uniref:ABC1 atypical kinase-like domain-containing protein n=1 Tax=Entomortierella chlamydospora TaxID=101097 RepID=A0A9P6SY73_9FUNG|nr:hypothetical protein BGZ80_000821 [Entomortierella chlamydospora]
MSARRFADAQALAAVGASVSRKFLALEMKHLKAYAATSSLLKKSSPSFTSAVTAITHDASSSSQRDHQNTSYPSSETSSTSTGSAWIDQILSSATSPLKSVAVQVSQPPVTTTDGSLPSNPSFLTAPVSHGHSGPTITTARSTASASESSKKRETQINRDVLETIRRESKWLDSLPAEDITKLNKGDAELEDRWTQKERLGPRMMVYEPLNQTNEEADTDSGGFEEIKATNAISQKLGVTEMSYSTPSSVTSPQAPESTSSLGQTTASATEVLDTGAIGSTTSSTASTSSASVPPVENSFTEEEIKSASVKKNLSAAPMPTSRIGRLFHYGGLAASLGVGALTETVRRTVGSGTASPDSPTFLTPANMDRLVSKLTKMRGAALKLGQMLSIQDNKLLSPELEEVLLRVQNSANFMPEKQMRKVMSQTMGSNWESEFTDFGMIPIAAASIGQVHRAVHRATGMPVAVKVQYPGVAASIDSDLANLKTLVVMSSILPRGMYLDNTIKVAQRELAWETDYLREAECIEEFGRLLKDDPDYQVPRLVPEASGPMVLTMEWMRGETMTYAMQNCDQASRNRIGTNILSLCLRELFDFQYMQTDPNWTNFLYNPKSTKLELLDFGATRGFDSKFTSLYLKTILAGAAGDREGCLRYSRELGFLTGEETPVMETAHINSLLTLSEPFQESAPDVYDFKYQTITQRVKDQIPTMLKYRLTPPPDETYSMHRKMAGAFLLCSKLGAKVECKKLFREITGRYNESQVDDRRGLNYGRGA